MEPAFAIGDQVSKVGGDYRYDGEVRGIVIKKSGKPRYVVEDDRGVLFIFNSGQIKRTRINTMACPKCNDTGWYSYDHNHVKKCEVCCKHDRGYWKLEDHYGKDNGKWCCLAGCGFLSENTDAEFPSLSVQAHITR